MPQDKSFLFDEKNRQTSLIAKVLSHPARLEIIDLLEERDFLIHKELDESIPLSTGSISQHLEKLLNVNIITKDEFSSVVGYRIDVAGWISAKKCIQEYFSRIKIC